MKTPLTIDDLRILAQRRLPRMFYDYVEAGSYSERTLHANTEDFKKIILRQFVGKDVSQRSLWTTICGRQATLPVVIAPTGLTGMMWPNGEIEAAKAAYQFGIPYVLSTMSICSMEDVARKAQVPFWYQLYIMKDREVTHSLMSRARHVGCEVLFVTVDLPVCAQRHQDIRNGLSVPPVINASTFADILSHPRWLLSMMTTPHRRFGNIMGHIKGVDTLRLLGDWVKSQFDPSVTWDDLKKIRDQWPGKLVLKGIMEPGDAQKALSIGADGIVVSNHGGRQLDGVSSSISALPDIARQVHGKMAIYLDGGIRSGQDVLKALSLGATAAFIGRAYVYALSAAGAQGVLTALKILQSEIDITLALCGMNSIRDFCARNVHLRRP